MQEVCKYYSYTRHSSIPDVLLMSKKVFDGLPKATQDIIMKTARDTMIEHNKIWEASIADTVAQLKAKGMIFNEVKDIAAFQKAAAPVWQDFEAIVGKDLIKSIVDTK
jgi:TRAP-type C4-dicarboxylate transport system substrate-binding protein